MLEEYCDEELLSALKWSGGMLCSVLTCVMPHVFEVLSRRIAVRKEIRQHMHRRTYFVKYVPYKCSSRFRVFLG